MLSLLRKIKSVLFNKTVAYNINHPDLVIGLVNGNLTNITYKGIPLVYRNIESSDLNVINQIFIDEEYKSVSSYFLKGNIEPKFIIDAGANVGYTTVYLKILFKNTTIACIEPDDSNFNLLNKNISSLNADNSIITYKAGLMGKSGMNLSVGNDFRGGSDWAKQTLISSENSALKSITIDDILSKHNFQIIDLLKIDIEGAETFLLEEDTNLDFLEKTKVIAIEIHDEFNCREAIYTLLMKKDFILFEDNETTIAFNKNLI